MHVAKITEIRTHAAAVINGKMRADFFRQDRLAEGREPGQLALMAPRDEAERARHRLIGVAQTVGRQGVEQTFLAAVDRRQRAVGEMAMAVIDRIATAVGGDQERVVPVGVEQRRQRVRFVMIVEKHCRVVAEAAGAAEFGDVENVVDLRRVVAQKLRRHVAPRIAFDIFAILFADPAHAADIAIEDRRKFRAAEADDVDVVARRAGDRQHLVDGEVGMLAAVALAARQPLELHRGL